jgi:hypothetical protein
LTRLVLSYQPITAACVFTCLVAKFPEKDIRHFHSDLDEERGRVPILEAFQDEVMLDTTGKPMGSAKRDFSPTILVGTIGLLGTGTNLQRAQTLFITEPQFTSTLTSQAEGRVHRFGQTGPVNVYNLTSDTIQSERDTTNRVHYRTSLAQLLEQATGRSRRRARSR